MTIGLNTSLPELPDPKIIHDAQCASARVVVWVWVFVGGVPKCATDSLLTFCSLNVVAYFRFSLFSLWFFIAFSWITVDFQRAPFYTVNTHRLCCAIYTHNVDRKDKRNSQIIGKKVAMITCIWGSGTRGFLKRWCSLMLVNRTETYPDVSRCGGAVCVWDQKIFCVAL